MAKRNRILWMPRELWDDSGAPREGSPVEAGARTEIWLHHTVSAQRTTWGTVDEVVHHMRRLRTIRPNLGDDVPYNVVLFSMTDGSLIAAEGRGLFREAAHCKGHNDIGIGLAFAGDFHSVEPPAHLHRQMYALGVYLDGLRRLGFRHLGESAPDGLHVWPHREAKATLCPGEHLMAALGSLRLPSLEKSRPILYKPEMVRALLNTTVGEPRPINPDFPAKWRTRRIIEGQPPDGARFILSLAGKLAVQFADGTIAESTTKSRFGKPGDLLWGRETWATRREFDDGPAPEDAPIYYRADEPSGADLGRWRPSIHMPKRAGRLWHRLVDLRIERLQEMPVDDLVAEGFLTQAQLDSMTTSEALKRFAAGWDEINGAGSWAKNPWVWVLDLERLEGSPHV